MTTRLLSLVLLATAAFGQMPARRAVVRASGDASVSVKPDQVQVSVGVTTQGTSAQDASDQNASIVTRVLAALRTLLGANADIKTQSYSISPRYDNAGRIIGYTASNTVQVTVGDLNLAGRIIDTAAAAGATNVSSVRFSLKDSRPARTQALRLAVAQAKMNCDAIAAGLGLRSGNVSVAEQGSSITTSPLAGGFAAAATPTPIDAGDVTVSATVTVEADLIQ